MASVMVKDNLDNKTGFAIPVVELWLEREIAQYFFYYYYFYFFKLAFFGISFSEELLSLFRTKKINI